MQTSNLVTLAAVLLLLGACGGEHAAGVRSDTDATIPIAPAPDAGAGVEVPPADAAGGETAPDGGLTPFTCAGLALRFDGIDDQASVVRDLGGDFTLEAWIRTSAPSPAGTDFRQGRGIMRADDEAGSAGAFGASLLGNKLAFGVAGASAVTITSTSDVNTGRWVHVAVVRDAAGGSVTLLV